MVVDPTNINQGVIYLLNVTISSPKALSEYGKLLVAHNIPMAAALTKITMVDESDYPQVEFEMAGILKEEQGMQAIERSAKKEWDSIPKPALAAPEARLVRTLPGQTNLLSLTRSRLTSMNF